MSKTVGAKNTNGTQHATVTLQPTFWGRSVPLSGGRTFCPLLVPVISVQYVFGSYPFEVETFGS